MPDVFMLYEVNPTTWFYLATLMIVGIFFKFRRFWSVRNLDLSILTMLTPGMLMVAYGYSTHEYAWVWVVELLLMIRMMVDPLMIRRPLLEVNLSRGGMMFSGISLVVFLIAGTFLTQWHDPSSPQTATMQQLLTRGLNTKIQSAGTPQDVLVHGPGSPGFMDFSDRPRQFLLSEMENEQRWNQKHPDIPYVHRQPPMSPFWTTQLTVILGQLAIVMGILLFGWIHFENFATGMAAATLYLLLPYSAQIPARIDHIVPAALLVWAVFSYSLPLLAGMLIGLAAIFVFYPLLLVPMWCSFYWNRGLYRFLLSFLGTSVLLFLLGLGLSDWNVEGYLIQYFNVSQSTRTWPVEGFLSAFRLPIFLIYGILTMLLAFWPAQKNLGTLLSSTAALMVGAQFCMPFQGGLAMAWFLPVMILVIFRPNLEDRTAQRALLSRRYKIPIRKEF